MKCPWPTCTQVAAGWRTWHGERLCRDHSQEADDLEAEARP